MAKTYIFTVGTSLFQKSWNKIEQKRIINTFTKNKETLLNTELNDKPANTLLPAILETLKTKSEYKDFTAEIATLKLITDFKKEEDKIVLFSSDTPDGAFCTRVNYEYMKNEMGIENIEMKLIDKTDINKPKDFVEDGLNNLLYHLGEIINTDSILCFTGGYKAFIPVLTILANENKIPMFYLFEPEEENPELIKMTIDYNDDQKEYEIGLYKNGNKIKTLKIHKVIVKTKDQSS